MLWGPIGNRKTSVFFDDYHTLKFNALLFFILKHYRVRIKNRSYGVKTDFPVLSKAIAALRVIFVPTRQTSLLKRTIKCQFDFQELCLREMQVNCGTTKSNG
jgi:hypothetical protein